MTEASPADEIYDEPMADEDLVQRPQAISRRDHVRVAVVRIMRADDVHDLAEGVVDAHRKVVLELVPGAEVEHVGATAVPGALTKGDVDVLVRVGEAEFPAAVEALSCRYAIHQPHNWTPTLASFTDPDAGELPVGIQLVVRGSDTDKFFGPFRDALIGSDALLAEYNELKLHLDGLEYERYTEQKGQFVERVLRELSLRSAAGPGAHWYGTVFDEVAEDYDRHRPSYPDVLVDRACESAGLGPGSRVLEIGCGTGQLTRSLLARGLRVTAVEPGRQLLARAREQLEGLGDVRFVNAGLEDASLPAARYAAAFSASAIHWVDPDVSWRRVADALDDGGSLALLSYFGLEDPHSAADQQALRAAITRIAPEVAADWPAYRDLDSTIAGVAARRHNVSEVWAWLGSYALARSYAADLFEDVEIATVPALLEHSADELNSLLGTMSFWARLSARQRNDLAAANQALQKRLCRPICSSTVACLVVARRKAALASCGR